MHQRVHHVIRATAAAWLVAALPAPGAASTPPVPVEPAQPAAALRAATTRFHFNRMPVRSALQLIAEEGDFDLVVSDAVQGTITLRLDDVTWEQALAVVLRMRGLRQRVVGSTRYVEPAGS
jgi:type IV pilus assembly protein PilQ